MKCAEDMKWISQERTIKEGEIIRFKTRKNYIYYLFDESKKKDKSSISILPDKQFSGDPEMYIYGIATGGFGMNINTMGNAIFVDYVSNNLQNTKDKTSQYSARWERHWGIEILEE